jgi:spoIIIJ-associated protein
MTQEAYDSSARPLEDYLALVESLLRQVIHAAGLELAFTRRKLPPSDDPFESVEYVVDFSGPDADLLLEKHGALLDALEHVVLKAVRLKEELFGKITFDCGDWRRLRTEELKLTAQVAAERVLETGEPFTLNPMTPRERRIIHLALRDSPAVSTRSEGKGPERRVVILPAASSPPPSLRR